MSNSNQCLYFRPVSLKKLSENHTTVQLSPYPLQIPQPLCPHRSANRSSRNIRKVVPRGTFTGPVLSSLVSDCQGPLGAQAWKLARSHDLENVAWLDIAAGNIIWTFLCVNNG